jgi:deoxyribonuclease-4
MRIGAHESIAGGLHLALERAQADGAEAVQIFTKSGRQWASKPIADADAQTFRAAQAACGLPVIVHDSYLINLGADAGELRTKSLAAFRDELERCEKLGVRWLVAHPGAHADAATGLKNIADGVRQSLDETPGFGAGVLLEITAGQGVSLGFRFEHLRELLASIDRPERTSVCLDTCHLFAAGYDLATEAGYAETMEALGKHVGFDRVRAFHLNDAVKGLGSRVDRHAHIGEGTLGEQAFARLMQDPRFGDIPAVVETPEGHWREEIALLRSLRDAGRPTQEDLTSKASAPTPGQGRNQTTQVTASNPKTLAKRVSPKARSKAGRSSEHR